MVTLAAGTDAERIRASYSPPSKPISIALLGLGQVGAAISRAAAESARHVHVSGALVRDPQRRRDSPVPPALLTTDADALFARRPDVIVEVLGGIEPAFRLVSRALDLGIPVVTANKSLIAAHGQALALAASHSGASLRYEAAVLAGVPFLGQFARRPLAARLTRIAGIVNGTSNFVLTKMCDAGCAAAEALAEAQRLGYAEPDPRNDVDGIDAAEKLAVLLAHFGWGQIRPDAIETVGIGSIAREDVSAAHDLGGTLKPVAFAERHGDEVEAFVGPAFVPARHRLALIAGEENALAFRNPYGNLFFSGPGAGPAATAATVLDDVEEAIRAGSEPDCVVIAPRAPVPPSTAWLIRLTHPHSLPAPDDIADLLGTHGIWFSRTARTKTTFSAVSLPASRGRIDAALDVLREACGCTSAAIRALED